MVPELEAGLARFVTLVAARHGDDLVSVVLFGSQATGRARSESDVDVLLVVRGLPRRRIERRAAFRAPKDEAGEPFASAASLILLTPEEAVTVRPFYLGILEGHRMVLDRDRFFRGVLDRLEARLAELGSRRLVDEHGNPYWDLKPDYKPGENIVL